MYTGYIVGAISLMLLQGILIFVLLGKCAKYKQTEAKLASNQDIMTEEIKAREAMAAAKKYSPFTMSARMFHDLNQPLNSIKMISGGILYLLNQGKKLPDEEIAECMKEISCQTDRIADMIKNLKM